MKSQPCQHPFKARGLCLCCGQEDYAYAVISQNVRPKRAA